MSQSKLRSHTRAHQQRRGKWRCVYVTARHRPMRKNDPPPATTRMNPPGIKLGKGHLSPRSTCHMTLFVRKQGPGFRRSQGLAPGGREATGFGGDARGLLGAWPRPSLHLCDGHLDGVLMIIGSSVGNVRVLQFTTKWVKRTGPIHISPGLSRPRFPARRQILKPILPPGTRSFRSDHSFFLHGCQTTKTCCLQIQESLTW